MKIKKKVHQFYGRGSHSHFRLRYCIAILSVLVLSFTVVQSGISDDNFEYHGFFRAGAANNGSGGDQEVFKAPGAAKAYRLGNENNQYGEMVLVKNWQNPKGDSAFFKNQFKFGFGTDQNSYYDETWLNVVEAYVQAGNFNGSSTKFWVGDRGYRRPDIHILDFNFLDMGGYGGGVEDIDIGFGKLAVAYFVGSSDDVVLEDVGRVALNTFDISVSDFNVPGGKGAIHISPSSSKGGKKIFSYELEDETEKTKEYDFEDTSGVGVTFIHTRDGFFGGSSTLTLQYGQGSGCSFSPGLGFTTTDEFEDTEEEFETTILEDINDSSIMRVTHQSVIQPNESLSMMTSFLYEAKDSGADENPGATWISLGLRPVFRLSEYYALAIEASIDQTDNESDDMAGQLMKFTVAPQVRVPGGFFARPSIRFFVTYATWSDDFKGQIATDTYGEEDTSGLTYGFQVESWW